MTSGAEIGWCGQMFGILIRISNADQSRAPELETDMYIPIIRHRIAREKIEKSPQLDSTFTQ